MKKNLDNSNFKISKRLRNKKFGHNSFLIWFTGLSGSGKSTLANNLEEKLYHCNIKTYVLDGDNLRSGINSDLAFTMKDRSENLRRVGEISKMMIDSGLVVIAAFISPTSKDRNYIRMLVGEDNFVEVFVNTSLKTCEMRDVKGLYKKARNGEIENFTGISQPYEKPTNPDIEIIEKYSIYDSIELIYNKINYRFELKDLFI